MTKLLPIARLMLVALFCLLSLGAFWDEWFQAPGATSEKKEGYEQSQEAEDGKTSVTSEEIKFERVEGAGAGAVGARVNKILPVAKTRHLGYQAPKPVRIPRAAPKIARSIPKPAKSLGLSGSQASALETAREVSEMHRAAVDVEQVRSELREIIQRTNQIKTTTQRDRAQIQDILDRAKVHERILKNLSVPRRLERKEQIDLDEILEREKLRLISEQTQRMGKQLTDLEAARSDARPKQTS